MGKGAHQRPFPHRSPILQVADFYSAPVACFCSAVDMDQGNHENLGDFILCEMTKAGNLKPLRTVPVTEFDLRTPVFKLNGFPIYVLRGNVRAVRARVTEGTIRRGE